MVRDKELFYSKLRLNIQNNKAAKIFVWLLFGAFLIYSHSLVFMYFEDFAFASLAYYSGWENVQGTNWTFSQLINYLIEVYYTWSGRVIFPGIKILLLRDGIWPFRIVQVISILFSFILLCRFATKRKYNVWTVIFTCSLYGLFNLQMFRSGIFWFSASATFVIPLVFVFLGFVVFRHLYENTETKHKTLLIVLGAISFFLASASVETTAFTVTTSLFVLILLINIKPMAAKFNDNEHEQPNSSVKIKKPRYPIVFFSASLIGSSFLLLAPGNFVRFLEQGSETTLSHFFLAFAQNLFVFTIRQYYFYRDFSVLLVLLAAFVFSCAYILWKNNRLSKNLLLITIPYSIFFLTGPYRFIPQLGIFYPENLMIMFLCYSYLAFMTFITVKYLIFIKNKFLLAFFLGALFSQVSMLVYSPHIVDRMIIIFYLALFALFIRMFNDITKYIKPKTVIVTVLVPVLILTSMSLAHLTRGYALNREVHIYNDRHLRQVSAEIKAGAEIEYIEVLDLVNPLYAYEMPERTWYWVKMYYDIPLHIPIVRR